MKDTWRVFLILALLILCAGPHITLAESCPVISRGSSGEIVTAIQSRLHSIYEEFPSPTGFFGPLTEAALKQWQKEHGIEQTGTFGPKTSSAMGIDRCPVRLMVRATSSQPVDQKQTIQSLLSLLETLRQKLAALTAVTSASITAPSYVSAPPGTGGGGGSAVQKPSCPAVQQQACVGGVLTPRGYDQNGCVLGYECGIQNQTQTSCSFAGQALLEGSSVTAYLTDSVPYGSTCQSQTRRCSAGTLLGSYAYPSCTVGMAQDCTWDGKSVTNGASVTAYRAQTVPDGQNCLSEQRTCASGTLTGSYAHASCAVTRSADVDRAVEGYLDVADGLSVGGWASDPDRDGPVAVHIYVDGKIAFGALADQYRLDVKNHAFQVSLSPYGAGQHEVRAYAIGVDKNGALTGNNVELKGSPKTFDVGCANLFGTAFIWCRDLAPYWYTRQQDTTMLMNNNIAIGINNSLGGTITQLYSNDHSVNLVLEHGGGAVQLSVWGYDAKSTNGIAYFGNDPARTDPTAYATEAQCRVHNSTCRAWGFKSGAHISDGIRSRACLDWGAGAPWNPIQAQADNCQWMGVTNDVAWQGKIGDNGWGIRVNNPYHFTKTDNFPGMVFGQNVTLGDAYARVDYSIDYSGAYTTGVHPQEIPAIFVGENGRDTLRDYYYYNGSAPYTDAHSRVVHVSALEVNSNPVIRFPGRSSYAHPNQGRDTLTEGWWSVCNTSGNRCVTVATFSPDANEVTLGTDLSFSDPNYLSGYITLVGNFNFYPGMHKVITVYLFPYRYDAVVDGKSIRQRIFELRPAN